jgi:hypothetical protein
MHMNVSSVGSSSLSYSSAVNSRNFRTSTETISRDDISQLISQSSSGDDASSFLQSLAADYESVDTNGDGISADELQTYAKSKGLSLPQGPGRGAPPALSKDELTKMRDEMAEQDSTSADGLSQVIANFDDADTDQDGAISMEEMQTYTKANNIEMPKPGGDGKMPPPASGSENSVSNEGNSLLKMLGQMASQAYQATATSVTTMGVSLTA